MRFEWDEAKRRGNIRRHGIDFLAARVVFAGKTVTFLDDRFNYGEIRFLTLGLLWGRVVAIVHTETDEAIRIISARKASKNEESIYFEEVKDWRD
ncbi:MAG: BrnT family toxin [Acidobacteriota bacterium]|nr:BrnT family toxin [Acidobacteriota bacterium]